MNLRTLLIIAAVAVVGVVVTDRCHQEQIDAYERRVARVQEQKRQAEARVDSLVAEAARAENRADSAVSIIEQEAPEIQTRIDTVRAQTPEELEDHPAIVERDSIIDDLTEQRDDALAAYYDQLDATAKLRAALSVSEASGDSLSAVLSDRPGDKPWWVPQLGIGPFVGVCATGTPCSGIGATLSWEIHL